MSDRVFVGKRIKTFRASPQFDGYSGVRLIVSDDVEYFSGVDSGRILTLDCPWGTQEIAENILSSVAGFQYQPYDAEGAIVDMAAELGDGVSVGSEYSGIYSQKVFFGPLCPSAISAPEDEELDHEYPYMEQQERNVTRSIRNLTASLKVQADKIVAEAEARESDISTLNAKLQVQADEISAKVSSTGGAASSFGWSLSDSDWSIFANGQTVLQVTKSGLDITGKITALSGGRIGGFDILADCMSYNNQTWNGTNTHGIYFGPTGIQLGKNFKVDAAGNLHASSGTFSGTVRAGSIAYGGNNGTLNGYAITPRSITGGENGNIDWGTLTTKNMVSGINASLGFADFANGVFNGYSEAPFMKCLRVTCSGAMSAGRFALAGRDVALQTMSVSTPDGSTKTIRYLGWSY